MERIIYELALCFSQQQELYDQHKTEFEVLRSAVGIAIVNGRVIVYDSGMNYTQINPVFLPVARAANKIKNEFEKQKKYLCLQGKKATW